MIHDGSWRSSYPKGQVDKQKMVLIQHASIVVMVIYSLPTASTTTPWPPDADSRA